MALHIMENDCLRVTVSDHGAELISAFDRKKERERIWGADPEVWNRHAPILFPFVGKVCNGTYRHNDSTYEMKTQHGFARDMDFMCVKSEREKVIHKLVSTQETKAKYPFSFTLYVTHELDPENPRLLRVSWEILNEGNEKMYYSIGGHPGFAVPESSKDRREDYWLEFPGLSRAEYILLDQNSGLALSEKKETLCLDQGFYPIKQHLFDRDALIFENGQIRKVRIARCDKTPYITLSCEAFPYVGIWSKPRGNFVCLEPWIGRTDDRGFSGELKDKPGEAVLDAGENQMYTYTIEFHE